MAKDKKRIDRRKLKQPDEFITWTARVWRYTQTHRKRVASVAGAVLLLVILISAYWIYRERRETRAALLASEALAGFAEDPTQPALFERILRDYPGTKGARLAQLYLGHVLYRKGEADRAAKVYGAVTEDSSAPESIRSQAILGQGYSLVILKRCEEAESAFGRVPASSSLAKQEAFLAVGRCYEHKGDRGAAVRRYQEFARRFPRSPFLTQALRSRINSLKGSAAPDG
ncbi:MAG: tol-pal system YbgF family protein [Nitrospinota bacterium]